MLLPAKVGSPVDTTTQALWFMNGLKRSITEKLHGMCNNNNNNLHVPAQVLGVCGTSLVSPGWLVHSVTIRAKDVQLLKIRQNNVIPDLSRSTWRV